MATIWKFRNSDDNFKKLLSVFTKMFIHFVWEGIAKTLDTSQNLLLVFTERWIHVQEFHHIRISFSEGNFKKPLLVFLVCPLFYLLLSNVFTGYPSTPTLQACPHTSFLLRTTTLFAVRRRIASNNHAVRSDIRGLPLCIHEVHSDTRGLTPAERRGRQTTRSPQRRARSQSSLGIFSLRFLVKLQTQLFERLKLLALILFRFQRSFCLFFQEICLLTRWPCR